MGAGLPARWIDRSPVLRFRCLLAPLVFLLLFPFSALAQDVRLIPSSGSDTFPACALSCSVLSQAQDSCVPPQAPVSNPQTYVSCFCQSSLLTQLRSDAADVCGSSCTSQSDLALLQKWYTNFCSASGNNNNNNNNNAAAGATTTTSAAAATATATGVSYPAPPSWISTHYRWVIMLIVLFVGFTILTIVGVWLKRRYDAKSPGLYHGENSSGGGGGGGVIASSGLLGRQHPAASSSVVNTDIWGPPQVMAHTRGFENMEPPPRSYYANNNTNESNRNGQPEMSMSMSSMTSTSMTMTNNPVIDRALADASRNSVRSSTRSHRPGEQTRDNNSNNGDLEIREA